MYLSKYLYLHYALNPLDHDRQVCTIQIWEQAWRNFLKVLKHECKSDSSATTDESGQTENESLPLLGQNLINKGNRGKRDLKQFKSNGILLGTIV